MHLDRFIMLLFLFIGLAWNWEKLVVTLPFKMKITF